MDSLNKLRLLAGIGIDPKTMVTPKKPEKIVEYVVPRTKDSLVPKSEQSMKLRAAKAQEALEHLEAAIHAIGQIPAVDYAGDFAHFANELHQLASGDGGGLAKLVQSVQSDYRKWKRAESSRVRMEQEEESFIKSAEDSDAALSTSEQRAGGTKFEVGQKVSRMGEPMTVIVGNSDGDYVAVAPVGKEDDINSAQMAHTSELEVSDEPEMQPSDEVSMDGEDQLPGDEEGGDQVSVGAVAIDFSDDEDTSDENSDDPEETDLEADSLGDEIPVKLSVKENVNYYYNTEDDADGVSNSVGKDTVYKKKAEDKNESPAQLNALGAASSNEQEKKVRVPANVKKALKDAITDVEQQFVRLGSTESDAKFFYKNLADAFATLLQHIEAGTVTDIKKAQIFMTTLMGPILHKIPAEVVNFVAKGGAAPSLKDYFKPVDKKFPITGPRNNLK